MTEKDLEFVIRSITLDGYYNKEALSNALALISKKIDLIVANDNLLSGLSRMLSAETNNIFTDNSSDLIKSRYWHILCDCIDKVETGRFLEGFSTIVSNILRSKIYDFKFSTQYQSLLLKLIQKS